MHFWGRFYLLCRSFSIGGFGDLKNLPKGTASDKALRENAFNIAKLASMVCQVLDKKSGGTSTHIAIGTNFENQ